MIESILNSVKKALGIDAEYTMFDVDIIMHINTAFMILNQLGAGPEFSIFDSSSVWSDYMTPGSNFEGVKSYVYLKVKTLFDPPQSSAVSSSYAETLKELEWRINLSHESEN